MIRVDENVLIEEIEQFRRKVESSMCYDRDDAVHMKKLVSGFLEGFSMMLKASPKE